MRREERLAEAFLYLADTSVQDFDLLDFLHGLCQRCVEVVNVTAAGALLSNRQGAGHVAAASDERMRVLEAFEAQNNEGPSIDACRTGTPVMVPELAEVFSRWPSFAPKAMDSGFRAGFGFPLRVRGELVGALDLFRAGPGPLNDADVRAAQSLADMAAIALVQVRSLRQERGLKEQLQGALDSRVAIEQAKGILSGHFDISLAEAFERLRRCSKDRNKPLREVAEQVVTGRLVLADLSYPDDEVERSPR